MSKTSPHDQLIRYRLNRAEEAYQDALLLMVQDGIVASIAYTIVAFMLLRLYLLMNKNLISCAFKMPISVGT
jgi:hypothetical protein